MKYTALLTLLALTPVTSLSQSETTTLETVIVSAMSQPQAIGDMSLSLSRVNQDDLALVSHTHINEAFQRVSGGWISRGNGQESLTALRSPVLTGSGSCGAFFMAADGLSLRAPGFCNVNQLFDANTEQAGRIEVIKGPATALYGSGAMHGLINVLSPTPTEGTEQHIGIEAGPHDYLRGRYLYNSASDRHGIVVAINGVSDDGYKRDSGYDQQKITLRHDYFGANWRSKTVLSGSNLNQETAGFIQGLEAYKDEDRKKENPNPEAYRDATAWRLHSTLSLELDAANSISITPYFRDNDMEFLMHFLPWQPTEENGHRSYGVASKWFYSGPWLQLTSGVDLEYTDGWLREFQEQDFSPNQPAGVHYDYQVDAGMASIWSQAEWDLHRDWSLSGGARAEYTRYDYNNKASDGSACAPSATACRFFRPADRDDDFTNLSLNLAALYHLNGSHSLFLRGARGFRAPQTTELYRLQSGQVSADLDSEQLSSIEFGGRGALNQLSYEVGSYFMKKKDVIFQDANRQNISGARTLHYGLDLSLRAELPAGLYLGLDATVARHEYDKSIRLLGSNEPLDGNTIDTAPEVFGSLRLGRTFSGGYLAELEWVRMDEYELDPDNNHQYDGHDLINLRITGPLVHGFSFGLRGTNLTDTDYAERADFGFGEYRYFVGEPRSLYVELEYQFGGDG